MKYGGDEEERKEDKETVNSRNKGAAGERELAGKLRDYGYNARRGSSTVVPMVMLMWSVFRGYI